jgi:hypothetical protein
MLYTIPYPFRFNPLKHHLSWVLNHIQYLIYNSGDENTKVKFIEIVKSINNNYVDIYTGYFSPEQIIQEIREKLKTLQVLKKKDFSLWIKNKEFQLVNIPDGSAWVLRESKEKNRFIHVHPSRNSHYTVRVHGNSWKTAVVAKTYHLSINNINLQNINELRKKYLALSPIKNLNMNQRLINTLKLLEI